MSLQVATGGTIPRDDGSVQDQGSRGSWSGTPIKQDSSDSSRTQDLHQVCTPNMTLFDLTNINTGDVTLLLGASGLRRRKIPAVVWSSTLASTISTPTINITTLLRTCQSITTVSGDIAPLGCTVLVRNVAGSPRKHTFARLREVIALDSRIDTAYTTTVQLFRVGECVHAVYDAPCIALSQDLVLVSPKVRVLSPVRSSITDVILNLGRFVCCQRAT